MAIMEDLTEQLLKRLWARLDGHVYQERLSGAQAQLYAISLLVVFLCLAALYELVYPLLGHAGGAAGGYRRAAGPGCAVLKRRVLPGWPADGHRPVGNAILIVEFANELNEGTFWPRCRPVASVCGRS